MPVVARQIQPSLASNRPLPTQLQNALEATAVFTFGSLIRQISDLARLSEDLMGEMAEEIRAINDRTKALGRRLSVIQQHVAAMDVEKEVAQIVPGEVRLEKTPFCSNNRSTQRLLSVQPPPTPLREVYEGVAHPIPSFGGFDGMRKDGVTPSNCISDPSFFFEHWRYTMQMKTVGKRSSAAIVEMDRDPSVDPEPARAVVPAASNPRAQRTPHLLLDTQDPTGQIHRHQKMANLSVPQPVCVGTQPSVSVRKLDADRMVFELCDADISPRCGSALEHGLDGPCASSIGESPCKMDETSFPSESESGATVSSLIYQDENVIVRATTPANKPKRRFTFSGLRRSFRRTSSKERQTIVEEETEKTEGGMPRKGSFRRTSVKRKSQKSENTSEEDSKEKTVSLGREVRAPVEGPGVTDIQRCEEDAHAASDSTPFSSMPRVNNRQGIPSDQRDVMTYDSGVETASSSFDPESRTTSVSSSGTLNSVAKQELSIMSVKPGTVPPPPPPPPLPGANVGGKGTKQDSTKRVSVPAISVVDKVVGLRRNLSADSRPSSMLMSASKPTLLLSQFRPPPENKPSKAPIALPVNGRNGVKVPPATFTESNSPPSLDSPPINDTVTTHTPAVAVQDLYQTTNMAAPMATRSVPDTNDLLMAIKRAVQQRRSLLREGSDHGQPLDVAAILERRNVLSMSDDDTDGSNDEWD